MAELSKSIRPRFTLAGQDINAYIEWESTEILATFENDNVQANIDFLDSVTFTGNAIKIITDHINAGLSGGVGIMEGIDFQMIGESKDRQRVIFDGYVDLSDGLIIDEENSRVIAKIIKKEGLNNFAREIEGITYGGLVQEGLITSRDYVNLDYTVEPPTDAFRIFVQSIIIYLMVKEALEATKDLSEQVATALGIGSSSPTGSIGATAYQIAVAIVQAAYVAAILIAIVQLGKDLIEALNPPKRTHKCIKFETLITKVCEKLGLGFETDIDELDNLHYLASNPNVDTATNGGLLIEPKSITEGIPNVQDYGYSASEAFELAIALFNVRYAIIDGKLQFRSANSNFWIKQSSYVKPNTLQQPRSYNTDEVVANRFVAFQTDTSDLYTVQNFGGTNYQVVTVPKSTQKPSNVSITGLDNIQINAALGNRKDRLTDFESALSTVASVIDGITGVFGGGTNYASQINNKVGTLKVSTNNHSLPKLIWLEGGQIPLNHRDKLNAKVLYDKYHSYKSFVSDNFVNQKIVTVNETVPFGFDDFLALIENSYFVNVNSVDSKATEFRWVLSADKANLSYWSRQVYTTNLEEQFINPS